jgi:hypothetical protein
MLHATPTANHPTARPRGFTLLELLVTIGVIFLLASLIIVALGGVRAAANRADTTAALRQMVFAHSAYSSDNRQRLMPGNVDAEMYTRLGLQAKRPGGDGHDPEDAGLYVWRLAIYLDNEWQTMFRDYRNKELNAKLAVEFENGIYGAGSAADAGGGDKMGISNIPSFGMNSVFVGGDNVHGGDDLTDLNPWDNPAGKIAATRTSEIKNPARLIVFAPSVYPDGGMPPDPFPNPPPVTDVEFGSPELRPPMLGWERDGNDVLQPLELQWTIQGRDDIQVTPGQFDAGGGVPIARWGTTEVPAAHFDGSVLTTELLDLQTDFQKWSPFAVGH